MKKFLYLAIYLFTVSLFSCSDDDQPIGPYVPQEVTISDLGTPEKPATWGDKISITGGNFSEQSAFFILPVESKLDPDQGTPLKVIEQSGSSVTLQAPITNGNAEYELYQIQGEIIYSLGNLFFLKQKFVDRMIGGITINDQTGSFSSSYHQFYYNEGKLDSVVYKSLNSDGTSNYKGIEFEYKDNLLFRTTKKELALNFMTWEQQMRVLNKTTYDYNQNERKMIMTVLEFSGWPFDDTTTEYIYTFTFNENGNLASGFREWVLEDQYIGEDENHNPIWGSINKRMEYNYLYDSNGNLIESNSTEYSNGNAGSANFTKFTKFDNQPTFFPKSALNNWYWLLPENDILTYSFGLQNNVVELTYPKGPGTIGDDPVTTYEYEYDKEGFPIKIYTPTPTEIERKPMFEVVYLK
ncbi:MAG: hypothetical protein LUH22_06355 [Bacteroides sp.]|nr:hypothetical protein [Bacteroides sp.]